VTDGKAKTIAIVVTVAVHAGLGFAVARATAAETDRLLERESLADEKLEHIEAGLAMRSKSSKGRKTRQPQREVERKTSPNDVAVNRDDTQKKPDDKEKKEKDPLGEVDPESVFNKHRQGAEGTAEPTTAEQGSDEESQEGRTDGSDLGRLADPKGDPYIGELNDRLHEHWEVPSTVTDENLVAYACIRLDAAGQRAEVQYDKSGNATFDAAVERSVKAASEMETPVPDHQVGALVKGRLCFAFRP
jgi:hypothetical protein